MPITLTKLLVLIAIVSACSTVPTEKAKSDDIKWTTNAELDSVYQEYGKSLSEKNYEAHLESCLTLLELASKHPNVHYMTSRAYANLGEKENAIKYLKQSKQLGGIVALNTMEDSTFAVLAEVDGFNELLEEIATLDNPIGSSEIIHEINEPDVIPEGVAYDAVEKKIYLSSLYKHKIISIDSNGMIADFKPSRQDGLLSVVGMEVDEPRRNLWACSSFDPIVTHLDLSAEGRRSTLNKYDLSTGDLLKKYAIVDSVDGFFNDVTVGSNGDVYLTDSFRGKVFFLDQEGDQLKEIPMNSDFPYPNGLALSSDNRNLFVSCYTGTYRLSTETWERIKVKSPENTTLIQIDGMAFYENSLIAHQGGTLGGIHRYHFNNAMDSIVRKEIIELNHPDFDYPTTGEIAGSDYVYIANAQLRKFNADNSIYPIEQLKNPIILKAKLN